LHETYKKVLIFTPNQFAKIFRIVTFLMPFEMTEHNQNPDMWMETQPKIKLPGGVLNKKNVAPFLGGMWLMQQS